MTIWKRCVLALLGKKERTKEKKMNAAFVEKMKAHIDPSTLKDIMNGKVEDKPAENGEPTPEEIRKELSEKKKDELVAMAKELEFTDEQLMEDGKLKTKDAIIELLMSAR